jgi:tetratricopeptide (TPR) repeat protein
MAPMFKNLFKPKTSVPAPREVGELLAAATDAYQSRDFSRAVPLYERVLELQPDNAEAHYKCANALRDLGRAEEALDHYDRAVLHKADFAHAWCNRGVVLQGLGRGEAALASYDRAIEFDPTDAISLVNRGALLQSLARWSAALDSYDRALTQQRSLPQAWFHRGNVLRELGRLDDAAQSHREALALQPDHPEAHYNLGVLLEKTGQLRAALSHYDRAADLNPGLHQAHFNRAGVLRALKDLPASLAAYDRAIAVKGDYAEAFSNRGVALQELGRWAEALASYDRAVDLRPDDASGHFNRGTLFAAQRRWEAALAAYDQAIALRADLAEAHCERGRVLLELKRPAEALQAFGRAVQLQPEFAEAQYNRSLALLLTGDYENGWRLHEWRWKNAERLSLVEQRPHPQSLWLGAEPVRDKTVLLYWEQGLGDTLQFCRFATSVAERGATVILEVQPPLVGLLQSVAKVAHVVGAGTPLPAVDYRCPLLSLPLALGVSLETIPGASGYLHAAPNRIERWRERLGTAVRPRVGLAWSGNSMNANDRKRSCLLGDWIPKLPRGLDYFCLQKDVRPEDRAVLAKNPWMTTVDDELHDFGDTAALCDCMDLIIGVDTSVVHLGGALGRPTWVLLPYDPDWRWLLDRDDSPWYLSAKLYRQQRIDDWAGVFERVAQDLRARFGLDTGPHS